MKNIDNQSFDRDIMKATDGVHEISYLEGLVNHCNRSLHDGLDKHAPIKIIK